MKKFYLLTIIGVLFLSGCVVNTNRGGGVNITVKENDYKVNNANQFVSIDFKISNNLGNKIYFEDTTCGSPLKIYQLSGESEWKVRSDLISGCMGLAAGKDVPQILKSGKSLDSSGWGNEVKKSVSNEGTYKMEFVYYLSEEDYQNRASSQSVFSNQFTLSKIDATKESVIDACKKADPRESRFAECLYVSAKNTATKDVNLAVNLCKEIEKFKNSFDGCYDGVALMLQRGGMSDKVNTVCNNHRDANKIKRCIDSTTKFE